MNRRDFLRFLIAAPIAAELDVEKLLWVPRPIVTVPGLSAYPLGTLLTLDEINAITHDVVFPGLADAFFRPARLYDAILGVADGRGGVIRQGFGPVRVRP